MLLSVVVNAANPVMIDNIYYNLNSSTKEAQVTNSAGGGSQGRDSYSGSVIIPSSVSYNGVEYSVTSIGAVAFMYCSSLTSVTIPNSVKSIGSSAFHNCTNLTSVISLITNSFPINDNVFAGDNNFFTSATLYVHFELKYEYWGTSGWKKFKNVEAYIPNIDGVYYYLFLWKKEATVTNRTGGNSSDGGSYSGRVSIPNVITFDGEEYTVTNIGEYAFYNCSNLSSVTIPDGVKSIGNYAFSGCSKQQTITIPNSMTSIGKYAFQSCRGLTSITIPDGVTSIEEGTFDDCTSLKNVYMGNSVTSIGYDAFGGCSKLTSITIPGSVTSIGDLAFADCNLYNVISLITDPFEIGEDVFDSSVSTSCTLFVLKGTKEKYQSTPTWNKFQSVVETVYGIDGIFYNLNAETSEAEVTNRLGGVISGTRSYSGNVSVPPTVTYDGVEYNVTSIGKNAFYGSVDLTSVSIPSSVTSIGEAAFRGCGSLTSVTIPNGVTSIGNSAFSNCGKLTSVTIPNSVKSIGGSAFRSCNALTSVTSWIVDPFEISEDVFYANGSTFTSATLYVPKGSKEKYIATAAWNKFQTIEELIPFIDGIYYNLFPETNEATVTNRKGGDSSGGGSYSGSVDIPSTITYDGEEYTVTNIGEYAFVYCRDLTSVTIPDGVKSIGEDAFSSCSKLETITIPDGVTSLGNGAFQFCRKLKTITIPNSVTSIGESAFMECYDLTSVTIPDGVTIIDNYTFYDCQSLTSITIPAKVTSIGEFAFVFSGLTSVTIPEGVTSIEEGAFGNCQSLTSVTIPNSVKSIGEEAFYGCSKLTSVTSLITEPFAINENVFSDDNDSFTSATLNVPKGTKEKYEATPAWNLFQKIEEMEDTKKGDVNDDGTVDVADIACIIDVMAGKAPEYKDQADVNKDKTVDVADIAIIIDIMAGKDVDTPEEQPNTACNDNNHPHWIDLGLPSGTKWACCNVGASKPEDYGDYYTVNQELEYDYPTLDQMNELLDNTTSEWTTQNGVNGRRFTSKVNGKSVFLPAAGGNLCYEGWCYIGSVGYYWTSTLNEQQGTTYYVLGFESENVVMGGLGERFDEFSVRPVRKDAEPQSSTVETFTRSARFAIRRN